MTLTVQGRNPMPDGKEAIGDWVNRISDTPLDRPPAESAPSRLPPSPSLESPAESRPEQPLDSTERTGKTGARATDPPNGESESHVRWLVPFGAAGLWVGADPATVDTDSGVGISGETSVSEG